MPITIEVNKQDPFYLKGVKEGREEGAYQKAIETARNLYTQGIVKDIKVLSQATGLSEEELKEILSN